MSMCVSVRHACCRSCEEDLVLEAGLQRGVSMSALHRRTLREQAHPLTSSCVSSVSLGTTRLLMMSTWPGTMGF